MELEADLTNLFPGLRVVETRLANLSIKKGDPTLEAYKAQVQQRIRDTLPSLEGVKDVPILRAYRDFFWRVGIDPTKIRPAGEALTRRILAGKGIPTINTFVDSYNLASVETSVAIAAFDLSKLSERDLVMRRARPEEPFVGIGMDAPAVMRGVEIVIEDRKAGKLVAVYPYRDADDSKVTEDSKEVLLVMCGVPGIDMADLERARDVATEYVNRFCGGRELKHVR